MNDPAHPVWGLARMLVRVGVVAMCLAFVYKSVDERDLLTLALFAMGDAASSYVRPPESK